MTEVTLLNPYNFQSHSQDKFSVLDIKAKGENGQRFNIEIQVNNETHYDKRALYYWGKLYTEQLQTTSYQQLSKAIGIHILNFNSIPTVTKYHNVFHITEKETGVAYFSDLELHTLVARIKNSLDMWIAFLTRHDLLNREQLPAALNHSALKKALGVLDVINFGAQEREPTKHASNGSA